MTPKLKWHRMGTLNRWRTFCGDDSHINAMGGILGIIGNKICVYPPRAERHLEFPLTPAELSDITIAMCRAEAIALDIVREEFGALLGMVKP